jgi:ubiquinone/menaquinone biosynthesis C-methylase UbiE
LEELIRGGFSRVDQTNDPSYYLRYLDTTTALEFMQKLKQQTYQEMGARPGARLLDVGCGTGDDVRALAQIVGPGGWVAGVDNSEQMVAEARKRSEALDLPVEFRVGNATHLDFADNTFDGCRAERVLIHVDDPRAVLAEMVRVTKPGGRIVAMDADWDMILLDAPNRELTRKVLTLVSNTMRNNWIARQVPGILKQMGLQEVVTGTGTYIIKELPLFDRLIHFRETIDQATEARLLDRQEVDTWLAELEERDRSGLFFGAMCGFITGARKQQ